MKAMPTLALALSLALLAVAPQGGALMAEVAQPRPTPAAAASGSGSGSCAGDTGTHGLPLLQMPLPGQPGALFQSAFGAAMWSGTLLKRTLAFDAAGQLQIGSAEWDTAALMARQAPALRPIYTLDVQSHASIPLQWNRLSAAQRSALDLSPLNHAFDGLGRQRIDFLRGERSLEIGQPGGVFLARQSVMGNPLNGPPVLVGAPSTAIEDATYGVFFDEHKARRSAVYLGANDAMLHAFDALDGHELFAYIPNAVMPDLAGVTVLQAGAAHGLDGAASAFEASLNGHWKTVLLSGMGSAARGMFALDVSDPAHFERGSAALWEFGAQDDPDLGHLMAAPVSAKFKTKVAGGVAQYRYFAVTSSGPDGVQNGNSIGAALFLLALDKAPAAPWVAGVNYFKLTTPATAGAAAALSAPALAVGADGAVLYAYAGDMQGNLWRFDFSGLAPWPGSVGPGHDGATPQPLFVARDADGMRQPITQQPTLVFAPDGGYLVVVGTGKPLQLSGPPGEPPNGTAGTAGTAASAYQTQSLYALHDTLAAPPELVSGRAALLARTLGGSVDSAGGFTISGAGLDGDELKLGWYFDYLQSERSGERSLSSAILLDGTLFFNTTIPGQGGCSVPAARNYHLDVLTGLTGSADAASQSALKTGQLAPGATGAPVLVFGNGPASVVRSASGSARVTNHVGVINLVSVDGVVAATGSQAAVGVSSAAGRMGWREIANWQQLHAQAH